MDRTDCLQQWKAVFQEEFVASLNPNLDETQKILNDILGKVTRDVKFDEDH